MRNSGVTPRKSDLTPKNLGEPKVFAEYHPDMVVHHATQAGVRYSTENPDVYIESNIVGFLNILETHTIMEHYDGIE